MALPADPPGLIVQLGALVYPLPLSVIITLEIELPVNTAFAVAVFPGLGGSSISKIGTPDV